MAQPAGWSGLVARLAGRALVNPATALDLLTLAWAFRRRGWWREPPFLPVPDATYVDWRLHTAYGAERELPPIEDVLRFARWRRRILRD